MAEHGLRKWLIVITVISAAIIELIDTSIVNVALTDMSGNLGATIEDAAWVITAYAIANVIIIPMTSFLGALFGRRNYYIGSILLFTLASFFCGHAGNLWELVAFRFLQGVGGGALLSTSQAILFETFTLEERPLAAGIFSLGIVIGPTIGPTLGGWIIDNHSWPWIFYVNIPIGIAAAILSYIFVKEPEDRRKIGKIDWLGIVLLVVGIASLQFVLERGEQKEWFETTYIAVLAVVSAVSLIGFIIRELVIDYPIVDLSVLTRSANLSIAAVLTFVLGFGLFSSVFIIPVFLQRLVGYDAMQTGLILLPGALTAAFLLPLVGRVMQTGMKPQPMVMGGFFLTALYCWMVSGFTLDASGHDFFWPLIIRGIGMAMMSVPLTTLALAGLVGRDIGQAAALNNMMRQLGGSFGIALINTYIAHRMGANRTALITHVTNYDPVSQDRISALTHFFMSKGASLATAQQQAYAALEGEVSRQAALLSYMDAFKLVVVFFLLCIPLILFLRQKRLPVAPSGPAAAASEDEMDAVIAH